MQEHRDIGIARVKRVEEIRQEKKRVSKGTARLLLLFMILLAALKMKSCLGDNLDANTKLPIDSGILLVEPMVTPTLHPDVSTSTPFPIN